MDTIKRHRYVAALAAAGALFLTGTLVVANRQGISEAGNSNGLNINGVLQATNSAQPIPTAPPPARPTAVNVPYTNVTSPGSATPPPKTQTAPNDGFDWKSFIASLTHTSTQTNVAGTQNNTTSDVYSFLPSALMSPPQQQSTMTMSDSQKALHGWGEDAGGAILSYEISHPNQPAILTNHMQDRENPTKIAAMKQLGTDLQAVGDTIDNIGTPPPQMSTAGPALSAAYREIGRYLAAIPDAKGDDATVKAILAYNKTAEAFVQKYVNVVVIFQANDVKFTQSEPGGVFMFPSN